MLLDQITKYIFRSFTEELGSIKVFDFLHLVHVWNPGISFGMGSNFEHSNLIFTIINASIIAVLVCYLYKTHSKNYSIAILITLSGAVGNLIDRLIFGAVYDFIDISFRQFHWPAFNLADAMVFFGLSLLMMLNYEHN